jgi:hypothetical protein
MRNLSLVDLEVKIAQNSYACCLALSSFTRMPCAILFENQSSNDVKCYRPSKKVFSSKTLSARRKIRQEVRRRDDTMSYTVCSHSGGQRIPSLEKRTCHPKIAIDSYCSDIGNAAFKDRRRVECCSNLCCYVSLQPRWAFD